jgi:2-C-methyl-D-erythritol 2,4-cyclodiphosphate synthase
MIRTGIGYDVHQLAEGRELWIGGVRVDYPLGLAGHSDADVLIHAICDALLGAAAMGDIGQHFPDDDPQYKGIDSKKLLAHTVKLLAAEGYRVVNIDSVVCAQRPKLAPYIPQMRAAIATAAGVEVGQVSVKATTTERLGFVGREEGIAAQASVLLETKEN